MLPKAAVQFVRSSANRLLAVAVMKKSSHNEWLQTRTNPYIYLIHSAAKLLTIKCLPRKESFIAGLMVAKRTIIYLD